ncbi:CRAL-TRIO domain-containing protein [Powellomyces hirtus]|nr:CRAL-TRIO domain-containing protein [Powellomyces hirtus]
MSAVEQHTADASFSNPLPITFGTQENYEIFRKRVRDDDKFVNLNVESVSDWWIVKFFDGARGNVDFAMKMLEKTLQWRIDYKWDSLTTEDFTADELTGKLYYHNTAKDGTPVLIWRISRHKADPKLVEHTVRFIVYMIVKGIKDGTIKSRITLLVDRIGSANENVEGIAFFRSLTYVLQTHFPEMLQRIIIFPTNWLLWTVWKVVKPFLDITVVEKVSLVGPKEYKQTLRDAIALENLSQRYGGTSVDWTDNGATVVADEEEDEGTTEDSKLNERDSAVSVSAISLEDVSTGKKAPEAHRIAKSHTWGVGKVKKMWGSSKTDLTQVKEK